MRIERFDPWANPVRRNMLAEALLGERTFSLSELLQTHAGRVVRRGNRATGTYYAQAWALVLFLQEGPEGKGGPYSAGFQRMLGQLEAGDLEQHARAAHIWSEQAVYNRGEALFRSFITEDLETFEREYVTFMRQKVLGEH
jgi:hypothetical protein